MKINIQKIENMTFDEIKKIIGKDVSQEECEVLKNNLLKNYNMRNDILDLITKYGINNTPEMVDILIAEMKIYFKLIYDFKYDNKNKGEDK